MRDSKDIPDAPITIVGHVSEWHSRTKRDVLVFFFSDGGVVVFLYLSKNDRRIYSMGLPPRKDCSLVQSVSVLSGKGEMHKK